MTDSNGMTMEEAIGKEVIGQEEAEFLLRSATEYGKAVRGWCGGSMIVNLRPDRFPTISFFMAVTAIIG